MNLCKWCKDELILWLEENTKGLNEGFDKNKLIFSYNDILEILGKD